MSDEGDNRPPEHEAQPQPAANEPPVAQPQQEDDELKGAAVEPAPKAPRRRWWRFWRRRDKQRTRSESRFAVLIALISALAALAGAGVGSFASYKGAQSQAAAQLRVAQANNTAQADQEMIKRRQTAYSDYLAAVNDVGNAAYRFHDALMHLQSVNRDSLDAAVKPFGDSWDKAVQTGSVVALVDSPEVEHCRAAMANKENDILFMVAKIMNQSQATLAVDRSAVKELNAIVARTDQPVSDFIAAARADISRLSGH
jgi:hypothetical protein